jgi:DNA-binding transcriptional MerR regulator
MFRIGEFSKVAQVPGSLLRYYDEIGLLKPAHLDPETGYRFYSARQLPRLHTILALKELGLSLDQIRHLVDAEVSEGTLRGMLTLRKTQVEHAMQDDLRRLRQIEARLQLIEASEQRGFDIVVKAVPAQPYLSVREVVPDVEAALGIMRELVGILPARLGSSALGPFTTVVHSETLESDRLDIELGVVLPEADAPAISLPRDRALHLSTLPAVEAMATTVQVGGFETNCRAYGAIGVWIEENGYGIIGPGREVLIVPPRAERLDDTVTEIQFPVALHREQALPTW